MFYFTKPNFKAMGKKNKAKTSRVIYVSKEDNIIFKQYLLDIEKLGVDTDLPIDIASRLFSIGLHNEVKNLQNESR